MKTVDEKRLQDEGRARPLARQGAGRRQSRFARRLLAEWKRLALPLDGERVVLGLSGGADSTALLLALDELLQAGRLDLKIIPAHLDHGLRVEAGAEDASWALALASELGFEAAAGCAQVKERAAQTGDNLEQAARRARYEFLSGVMAERGARLLLVAHTLDDQAETVLLRLMRGSGAEGLSGIEPLRALDQKGGKDTLLARPLLGWARRAETEEYCRERGVEFRVDQMNLDESFARVRVRRQLLPLMASFNGRVVEALARTARLLGEDASALALEAGKLLEAASVSDEDGMSDKSRVGEDGPDDEKSAGVGTSFVPELRVDVLKRAHVALRRRALRLWLERGRGDLRRLELAHLLAVERLFEGERGGRLVELPGGLAVRLNRGRLRLELKRG
ncbi:MAG TPA: tRNA lysidine(34) synthetase TilS [Pyrinomonadaceae bacterium]